MRISWRLIALLLAVVSGIFCFMSYTSITDLESKLNQSKEVTAQQQEQLKAKEQQLEEVENNKEQLIKEFNTYKLDTEKTKKENEEMRGVYNSLSSLLGYIPEPYEIDLLYRLVECEAGCEPYAGKIAVVNVVVNRIHSKKFPNTIKDVITQKYQFEPVYNGMIVGRKVSSDSKKAVREALLKHKKVIDDTIVNFWADYLNKDNPLWRHIKVKLKIGTQLFGADWID